MSRRAGTRIVLASLLLGLLWTCSTHLPAPGEATRRAYPTLLVINRGLESLAVYAEAVRLGTVQPAARECIVLRSLLTGHQSLRFKALAISQPYFTPEVDFTSADGWRIVVGTTPELDMMSLQPAPRCRP